MEADSKKSSNEKEKKNERRKKSSRKVIDIPPWLLREVVVVYLAIYLFPNSKHAHTPPISTALQSIFPENIEISS